MRRAAQRIVEKLRLHGHEAFFAGGWVRDYLLRRKPLDIDIATDARPEIVQQLFPHSRSVGEQFGVIQVYMYGHIYEVATFRSDNAYLDGRHPSSVTFSGPEQDALRRDFTINGLFYDPVADRLIDYVHGRSDIQKKLIRAIGDPYARFGEDKLRILRAIRFACNLGFRIVPETWDAIRKFAPEILEVSWERIRDELISLFTGPAPGTGLHLLRESGLLIYIMPEAQAMIGIPQSMESPAGIDVFSHTQMALALLHKPSAILAFASLLHDVGKTVDRSGTYGDHAQLGARISQEVCLRLRMSNEETDRITDLVSTHVEFPRLGVMRESSLKRLFRKPSFLEHLELFRVNCLSNQSKLDTYWLWLKKLKEYRRSPEPPPLISGDDLIEMGYSPGPVFSEILREIEDLQLDGKLQTREDAQSHVKETYPLRSHSPS